jgi:nitroreductase
LNIQNNFSGGAMDFKTVVEQRTSVRKFTDESVPVEDITEILRLASCAPCVGGAEFWKFIVITDQSLLRQVAEIVKSKYDTLIPHDNDLVTGNVRHAIEKFASVIGGAPTVVAVLTEPYEALIDKVLEQAGSGHEEMNKMRNFPDIQTVGAVVQTILLSAVNAGYSGCWLSGPMIAKQELSQLLDIPKGTQLSAFVALGKAGEKNYPRVKRPIEELITFK